MCAIAERAWGSPEQSFSAFEERLREHLPRLTALGVNHRPLD
jgi:hexosaminidase